MPKGEPIVDFTWLKALQARKGLQLTTCETPAGKVHVDGQPAAFVAELIRLAEIGQKLEIATAGAVASVRVGTVAATRDDRVRTAVESISAEIAAPLAGPTHGAWDRGRIAGLKEALVTLSGGGVDV